MRREAQTAVPALIAALGDDQAFVRSNAAAALGAIRTDANEVVPALVKALSDRSGEVRAQAAEAIGRSAGRRMTRSPP
jgi:HEAT repeat protein